MASSYNFEEFPLVSLGWCFMYLGGYQIESKNISIITIVRLIGSLNWCSMFVFGFQIILYHATHVKDFQAQKLTYVVLQTFDACSKVKSFWSYAAADRIPIHVTGYINMMYNATASYYNEMSTIPIIYIILFLACL